MHRAIGMKDLHCDSVTVADMWPVLCHCVCIFRPTKCFATSWKSNFFHVMHEQIHLVTYCLHVDKRCLSLFQFFCISTSFHVTV